LIEGKLPTIATSLNNLRKQGAGGKLAFERFAGGQKLDLHLYIDAR
jgi:hypothetical protein